MMNHLHNGFMLGTIPTPSSRRALPEFYWALTVGKPIARGGERSLTRKATFNYSEVSFAEIHRKFIAKSRESMHSHPYHTQILNYHRNLCRDQVLEDTIQASFHKPTDM